jgi:transcriptional regulator with XRE-family HTH domain
MPFKSDRIRQFRERFEMTQTSLAKVLGVPQSTVARWETGFSVPTAAHIGLICDFGYVQGIRPDFFFPNCNGLPPPQAARTKKTKRKS